MRGVVVGVVVVVVGFGEREPAAQTGLAAAEELAHLPALEDACAHVDQRSSEGQSLDEQYGEVPTVVVRQSASDVRRHASERERQRRRPLDAAAFHRFRQGHLPRPRALMHRTILNYTNRSSRLIQAAHNLKSSLLEPNRQTSPMPLYRPPQYAA